VIKLQVIANHVRLEISCLITNALHHALVDFIQILLSIHAFNVMHHVQHVQVVKIRNVSHVPNKKMLQFTII